MRNITEEGFAYLRNINTRPGANAGRSIDPTKPGPDADRIAELERDLERAKDIKFEPDRHRRIDELCAELSRLRNEQPRDKTDAWDREHAKSEGIIAAIKTHVLCDYHAGIRDAEAAADEILAALAQSDAQPVTNPGTTPDLDELTMLTQEFKGYSLLALMQEAHKLRAAQSDAQPVAWRSRFRGFTGWSYTDEQTIANRDMRRDDVECEPLYTAPPRHDASGLMKAAELPLDVLQSASGYLCMDWDPETTTAVEAVSVIWNIITNALRARAADRSGK